MSKFVKGELCEDIFGRPLIFLNYIIGLECIVYNPKGDIFEISDSTVLKPVDKYYFHTHTIDLGNGFNAIREAFNFKLSELYQKALPIAEKHLNLFKSLEGCTIDLSDSKFEVAYVTISDKESHNWQDLIEFIGIIARDVRSKRFCAPLSVLKPNSELLRKMVEHLQEY